MDEAQKMVFEEIVNEVNFLEARCREAFETIYSKLERLKDLSESTDKTGGKDV